MVRLLFHFAASHQAARAPCNRQLFRNRIINQNQKKTETLTERQKDRRTEGQKDKETERQKDRRTEGQKNRRTGGQKDCF